MTMIQPITVAAPPFAALYLSDLPAGTARVEVWRRWRGVSERVRGDGQVVVLGGEASLIDWAADGSWSLHVPDEGYGLSPYGETPYGL